MYRRGGTAFLLIFFSFAGICQQDSNLLSIDPSASIADQTSYNLFLQQIHATKHRSDKALVHDIFKQAHKNLLKEYMAYSEIPELFATGKYDCLTATAFLSLVLNEFQIRYSLIETNYHIFLVVHLTNGDVLLETTDKFNGFVTDADLIQERIGTYKQNLIASESVGKQVYAYQFKLYRELSFFQLPGLLYFNQAIKSYNNQAWEQCADFMDKASRIYDSPRMEELATVLIQTVRASETDDARKKMIIARAQHHLVTRSVAGL
jgi:hypothetical protein